MNRIYAYAMLAGLVAGCATSREVRLADGWQSHVVSCGGPFLNLGHCLEKAGAICRGYGYTLINHEGGEVPPAHAIPTGGLPDLPKAAADLGHYPSRKLYVRCNG